MNGVSSLYDYVFPFNAGGKLLCRDMSRCRPAEVFILQDSIASVVEQTTVEGGILSRSDAGRGLSGHTARRFMSKLFGSAGLEDEVVAWYIGHGCKGTGAWHVGDTLNPSGNDNLVTRTCILELYQRFFAGRR